MQNIEYRVVLNACLFLFQRYLTCCPGVCDEIYMYMYVYIMKSTRLSRVMASGSITTHKSSEVALQARHRNHVRFAASRRGGVPRGYAALEPARKNIAQVRIRFATSQLRRALPQGRRPGLPTDLDHPRQFRALPPPRAAPLPLPSGCTPDKRTSPTQS